MKIMNFEGLEQMRYECTKQVIEAMTKVVVDEKASLEDRFKAAKIVDGMSDSIIKAYLMTNVVQADESKTKSMMSQLDKLTDKE